MSTSERTPSPAAPLLGLADLSADEALIVLLFREWCCAPLPAVTQHRLARRLASNAVYEALPHLFELFAHLGQQRHAPPDTGLLTASETTVLEALAVGAASGAAKAAAQQAQGKLRRKGYVVRRPSDMERSGRDELETRIAISALAAFTRL